LPPFSPILRGRSHPILERRRADEISRYRNTLMLNLLDIICLGKKINKIEFPHSAIKFLTYGPSSSGSRISKK
jgi:hypothetical protein